MSAAAVKKPTATKPPAAAGTGTAGRGFKAMAAAAVAAQPLAATKNTTPGAKNPPPGSPQLNSKDPKGKVTRHVDSKVAARNNALNAMGGVKVDVFVRVRPKMPVDGDDKCVVVASEEAPDIVLEDPAGHPAKYTYDKVYGEASTQEQIYEDSVAPIVEQVCRGLSCAIFAYGQTGAGKTFTMRGDLSNDPAKQGIIQRSVLHLFKRLHEHDYSDVKVNVSFLEIYNEELEDLLVDKPKDAPGKPTAKVGNKLTLVDDPQRGSMVNGLTESPVSQLEEVMTLLAQAEARCRFSETKMNKMSNRAHRIFTIICNFRRYDNPVLATLTFVDLAGSEDISKSGAKGLTAREASHINKSLLTLGRVINALACNEKHIPYRDSKLTRLLSEALGGVCKTSFIACVSPCANSLTESNSTLRYAERAMEALNISQLPRWKQDEIMIDGLTRRVQQLTDELDAIQRIHYEEMTEMKNQRDSLAKENKTLKHQLGKARRKIDRLQARKGQLKTGLALMTQNRDVLQSQKDALVAELVETRRVRDGYLQDRNTLCMVLNSVRAMRNRLLSAHSNTENLLTADAQTLKKTIEGAITDIDDLHSEVARKKSLSSFNETLADDFRDRMSAKLRTLVQSISEFKVGQDDAYSQIQQVIAEQRSVRQKETSSLRSDVSRTATAATNLLNDIAQFAAEVESAYKSRLAKGREMSESNRAELDMALVQMRTNVSNKLDELRSHAANLDENLTQWADKIKLKLEESLSSADSFGKNMTQHIAAVQAHLEGASNAQLMHFDEHVKQLQSHMDTERAAVNDEAQRVINEMAGFVQRLISDHASKAVLRSERAVAAFTSSIESLTEETKELVVHQTQEQNAMVGKTNAWNAAFAKSVDEGQRANSAMQFTGKGILKKVVATSQNGEQDLVNGVTGLSAATAQQLQGSLALYKDFDETTEKNTAQYRKLVGKGTTDLQADSKKIGDQLHVNADKYDKVAAKEKKHLETMHETVRQSIEGQTDDLFDAEADAVKYVTNDIKRDTKDPPGKKKYAYPQKYAATAAYPAILQDVNKEWEREAGINDGKLVPGQGPDFAGQKGPEDLSGIITTFKNKPARQEEQEKLDLAAHMSGPEEYSSGEEEKDDEQEGEGAEGEGSSDGQPENGETEEADL